MHARVAKATHAYYTSNLSPGDPIYIHVERIREDWRNKVAVDVHLTIIRPCRQCL